MLTLNTLIPYFNEAHRIEAMLTELANEVRSNTHFRTQATLRFWWANDGSTDDSRRRLTEVTDKLLPNGKVIGPFSLAHEFIDLKKNSGKATAMLVGIKAIGDLVIKQNEDAIVAFWDADGELLPDGLFSMLAEVAEKRADIVFGSRFNKRNPQVLNFRHYLGNKSLTTFSNWFSDLNLSDVHCCARALPMRILSQIPLRSSGFDFEAEFVGLVGRIKSPSLKLSEVPITYRPRTRDQGKKIGLKHVLPQFWQAIRCRYFVKEIFLKA